MKTYTRSGSAEGQELSVGGHWQDFMNRMLTRTFRSDGVKEEIVQTSLCVFGKTAGNVVLRMLADIYTPQNRELEKRMTLNLREEAIFSMVVCPYTKRGKLSIEIQKLELEKHERHKGILEAATAHALEWGFSEGAEMIYSMTSPRMARAMRKIFGGSIFEIESDGVKSGTVKVVFQKEDLPRIRKYALGHELRG